METKRNWFADAAINAAMAENAPYMQAIGWQQDENGNYHQDPTTPGAEELRKALVQIGINAATDVFGGPLLEKALEYGFKGVRALKPILNTKKAIKPTTKAATNPGTTFNAANKARVDKVVDDAMDIAYGTNKSASKTANATVKPRTNVK